MSLYVNQTQGSVLQLGASALTTELQPSDIIYTEDTVRVGGDKGTGGGGGGL